MLLISFARFAVLDVDITEWEFGVQLRMQYFVSAYISLSTLLTLKHKLQALKDLYTHLTPIQCVNIAGHPNRPTCLDHIFNITEKLVKFVELDGYRGGYDDPAIITGLGSINGRSYMFIGQQKGRNTKENIMRNFGMPTPRGAQLKPRKEVLHCIKPADKNTNYSKY
ncbi:hypothetical protein AgCh_023821 [Apium graveolens]